VDLTARLREILLNYPEGTSILKEIVQVPEWLQQSVIGVCMHVSCVP
jgi:sacsin